MENTKFFTRKDIDDLKLKTSDRHKRTDFTPGRVPPINENTLSQLIDTAKEWVPGHETINTAIICCNYYYSTQNEIKEANELATSLSKAFEKNGFDSNEVNQAWERLRESARRNPATRDFLRCVAVNHDTKSEYGIDDIKDKYRNDINSQVIDVNNLINENENAVVEFRWAAEEFDTLHHEQVGLNQELALQFNRRLTQIQDHTDQFLNHLCDLSGQDREWADRAANAAIDPRISLSAYGQDVYAQAHIQLQEQRDTLDVALNSLTQEAKNLATFQKTLKREASNLENKMNTIDSMVADAKDMANEISNECYLASSYAINSIKAIEKNLVEYEYIFPEEQEYIKRIQESFNNIKDEIHKNVKSYTESSIIVGVAVKEERSLFYEVLRGEPKATSVLNALQSIEDDMKRDYEIKVRIGVNKL